MADVPQKLLHRSESERVEGGAFSGLMYPVAIAGSVELLRGYEWSSSSATNSSSSESTQELTSTASSVSSQSSASSSSVSSSSVSSVSSSSISSSSVSSQSSSSVSSQSSFSSSSESSSSSTQQMTSSSSSSGDYMEFGDRWLTNRNAFPVDIFEIYNDVWVYQHSLTSANFSSTYGMCTFANHYYCPNAVGDRLFKYDYLNNLLATYTVYLYDFEDFSVDETHMVMYRINNPYIDKVNLLTGARVTYRTYTFDFGFNGVFFDGKYVWGISSNYFRKMNNDLNTLVVKAFSPELAAQMLDAYKYGGYWYVGAYYAGGFYVYKCTIGADRFPAVAIARYGPVLGAGRLGRFDYPF